MNRKILKDLGFIHDITYEEYFKINNFEYKDHCRFEFYNNEKRIGKMHWDSIIIIFPTKYKKPTRLIINTLYGNIGFHIEKDKFTIRHKMILPKRFYNIELKNNEFYGGIMWDREKEEDHWALYFSENH